MQAMLLSLGISDSRCFQVLLGPLSIGRCIESAPKDGTVFLWVQAYPVDPLGYGGVLKKL